MTQTIKGSELLAMIQQAEEDKREQELLERVDTRDCITCPHNMVCPNRKE